MGSGTLSWFADRGFELDAEATADDVTIRLASVPVPADGTVELRDGVELDRIEILFKASVAIQGEIGQLHGARVRLVTLDGGDAIELDARCEDIETGDILPVSFAVSIVVPRGAPERGGPRPSPTNEDDLDFEDETTLEHLVVNGPGEGEDEDRPAMRSRNGSSASPKAAPGRPPARDAGKAKDSSEKGLQALLNALARLDDEDEGEEDVPPPVRSGAARRPTASGSRRPTSRPTGPRSQREAISSPPESTPRGATPRDLTRSGAPTPQSSQREEPPAGGDERDQSLGAEGEAKSLLDLLVEGGNLELEGDEEVDVLVPGVAKILALRMPSDAKATRLSTWLLAQENVADLFIADDDLAEILERW
jgi:hypothetical protein